MNRPLRAATIAALITLACSVDPEIQEGPTKTYSPCNPVTGTCVPGLVCKSGLCVPPAANEADVSAPVDTAAPVGVDTSVADTAVEPTPDIVVVPDLGQPVDTATPPDLEAPPDIPIVPDVVETPDPGVTPQPDECDYPGNPSTCPLSETPGEFFYCRYEPTTANLTCQTSPAFAFQYGTPCSTNKDCDVSLGCHFDVCTTYCELGKAACPGQSTCATIGHPAWGACKPVN